VVGYNNISDTGGGRRGINIYETNGFNIRKNSVHCYGNRVSLTILIPSRIQYIYIYIYVGNMYMPTQCAL